MNGFGEGIKTALKMKDVGMGMVKTKRMSPMELLGGHKCKDAGGLQKILKKAREIELAKAEKFEG
jgi:quinone-modifying oxidoreductase subunit QmoC